MKKFLLPALLALLFLYFFTTLYCRMPVSDYTHFGSDSFFYQQLGVNLAKGHGYLRGAKEPMPEYRFSVNPTDKTRPNIQKRRLFFLNYIYREFYFVPGYPFFLAGVYLIFGISPAKVFILQMMMVAFSLAMLPWIGRVYWGKWGIACGSAAALTILHRRMHPFPNEIITESFILLAVTLWVLVFIWMEKKPSSLIRMFCLGIFSCGLLYAKILTALVPVGFVLWWFFIRSRFSRASFKPLAAFVLGFALTLMPWSIYASSLSGKLVLLSSQANDEILAAFNEDSIKDGGYHPEYRDTPDDPKYLYNRLRDKNLPPLVQLMIFAKENRREIPGMMWKKVYGSFHAMHYYLCLLGCLAYCLLYLAAGRLDLDPDRKIPAFFLIFMIADVAIISIAYPDPRYAMPFIPFFALGAFYLPVYVSKVIAGGKVKAPIADSRPIRGAGWP